MPDPILTLLRPENIKNVEFSTFEMSLFLVLESRNSHKKFVLGRLKVGCGGLSCDLKNRNFHFLAISASKMLRKTKFSIFPHLVLGG